MDSTSRETSQDMVTGNKVATKVIGYYLEYIDGEGNVQTERFFEHEYQQQLQFSTGDEMVSIFYVDLRKLPTLLVCIPTNRVVYVASIFEWKEKDAS